MAEEWTILAQLLRPQGRRGELLAEVLTDFPERFSRTEPVTLLPPVGVAAKTPKLTPREAQAMVPREARITAHWFPVGRNAGRVVLEFAEVDSINAAEALAGWQVALPQSERMPLSDDAVYISDLIGCTVYDGDTVIGVVEDVEFPSAAPGQAEEPDAPALLSVKANDGECLIPFVKAWLKSVDTEQKRIVMQLPAGLVEINRS
jgi:16S rRNA processing protein RimM